MNKVFALSYFSEGKHVKQNARAFRLLRNDVNLQFEFDNCYCTFHDKFRWVYR